MAPLPPLYDPARGVDKLPQPYRMVDKLISEIVEKALAECAVKDKQKRQERAKLERPRFGPHAVLTARGNSTCFTTPGIAGLAVVGTDTGEVYAHTARDNTAIGHDHPHESAVTAMDSGDVAATSAKVVVSASKGHLVVHDLTIKTAELMPLAKTDLPLDPDDPNHYPVTVTFSANACHIAVCYSSGALAVYELELPSFYYSATASSKSDAVAAAAAAAAAASGATTGTVGAAAADATAQTRRNSGKLWLVVLMSIATVKGLLVGATNVGACSIEWQLQQRPDKSGKSDRFHKPARGIYMLWKGCNRLALSYLDALPPEPAGPVLVPPPTPPKPATPPKGAKGGEAATAAAAAPVAPSPADPSSVDDKRVQRRPYRGWLLPHGISCSCITQDGTMLAFGLEDGSVVVWDDQFGGHIRILPRLPSRVTALAYVHGLNTHLLCTSADGTIYVADFLRPEDSYTAGVKLPHAAVQVYFVSGDSFALCMCPGGTTYGSNAAPCVMWYDMITRKLVAECIGREGMGFGSSCLLSSAALAPRPGSAVVESAVAAVPSDETAKAVQEVTAPSSYPRWMFKESYFIAGAIPQRSTTFRPTDGRDADDIPDAEWPRDATLMLYKIDAWARYLYPDDNQSKASKTLLERMLAELNPPKKKLGKHVKYGVPDPDAPKPPPSSLRRAGSTDQSGDDDDDARSTTTRKHIAFEEDTSLFDDENSKAGKKQFKKEMRSGGYSEGPIRKPGQDPNKGSAGQSKKASSERAQSPPWHHTNPLARIHPDWEEAPVLARIMDRIGSKGGGRKKRDRRLTQVASEMRNKLAREPGAKPVLLIK
ncbi:hypothetical protein CEUSTIGMA_g1343.t1 [Chlamydomonas eustigma]|uniref:Uncharacterized protein n=1 Tax=Chlamydomonas eustigma TaxID=1157962 RepID=A0A250WSU7_9CHLO|nr:hypothetical protein CEUSTIGMA_g1343.t1 [Chlamydomonas eustigma]|eukprot:GAX73893.1 hypothetical protein CEUSTIGMA_g1343.t1 [Chlamydomonas eustigma]